MFTIDVSDVLRIAANLEKAEKQARFVTSFAMTAAMRDARTAEVDLMRKSFDRPTPYTLNSLQVVPARKDRLVAELRPKDGFSGRPAWKFLGPQIQGGPRKATGFEMALRRKGILRAGEFAMPSKRISVNAYGNVSGGLMTQVLSALGANPDALSNTTERSRKRKPKRNLNYVVFRNHAKAPDGIYLQKPKWAVPVFIFVGQPKYRPRFPFYKEAQKVYPTAFKKHFRAAWQRFVVNDQRKRAA